MTKIQNAFAGVVAGMILLLGIAAPADATPAKPSKSICETGGRGDADYRRKCMTRGTIADAAREWYTMPAGRKGHENRAMENRRSVCKFAGTLGGIRPATREIFFDVAYDRYLHNGRVVRWIGRFAAHDCRAMGYRV